MVPTESKPEILKHAAEAARVTAYLDYRDFLHALYNWLKTNLPRYSYLQFAEDLGFSKSNVVHLMVVGKRPLTSKAATRVATALQIKGIEKRYLEVLVKYNNSRRPSEREDLFRELLAMKNRTLKSALEKSQLEFFAEWYHPIILEMMRMAEFRSDPEWIAGQIHPRIRPEQARKSLELLTALGLAKAGENGGRHVAVASQLSTGDEIASIAVVRYHQKMIELGKESITSTSELERDISAITVCVAPETANQIKREVQAFRKKLLAMADESAEYQRVFQLNIQFFPVTGQK